MATLGRRIAKTQRGKRALAAKEPKLNESVKKALFLKGPKASNIVTQALKDLYTIKNPHGTMLKKRNVARPLEDASMVEFLSQKNDSSLFAFGSHTKKRPHNLVLGRLYDYQILDMVEVTINGSTFKSIHEFTLTRQATVRHGMAPLIIFNGDDFENETKQDLILLKSLLLDLFRGAVLDKLNLASLDRVIVCTAHNDTVFFQAICYCNEEIWD